LIRALAATPFELPAEAGRPFAVIGIEEVAETIAFLASRWAAGERSWRATWDLMHPEVDNFGDVLARFRTWLGTGGSRPVRLPGWLLRAGARASDWVATLGWRAPIRSNALPELRRGVSGNPHAWRVATAIEPRPLGAILVALPPTIQEKWFARLYFLKPAILACLVLFWVSSGLIAVPVAHQRSRDPDQLGGSRRASCRISGIPFGPPKARAEQRIAGPRPRRELRRAGRRSAGSLPMAPGEIPARNPERPERFQAMLQSLP